MYRVRVKVHRDKLVRIRLLASTRQTLSVLRRGGCHLEWHSTVCWPQRGGRDTQNTQKPENLLGEKARGQTIIRLTEVSEYNLYVEPQIPPCIHHMEADQRHLEKLLSEEFTLQFHHQRVKASQCILQQRNMTPPEYPPPERKKSGRTPQCIGN